VSAIPNKFSVSVCPSLSLSLSLFVGVTTGNYVVGTRRNRTYFNVSKNNYLVKLGSTYADIS
jgi:hypothetical protein